MKAAVYHGRGDVRIEAWPEPGEPGSGEVLLEPLMGSLCGTDLHEYLAGPRMIPLAAPHPFSGHSGPVVLGHEFVARVRARGEGVTSLQEGQRVVPSAGMWCGQCRLCQMGKPNLCERYFIFGLQGHGGLADLVRLPAKMCCPVPDACSDQSAAIAQPCAIALHALGRAAPAPGQSLALIGVGGIGSFLLAVARARGISRIVALDTEESRLDRARSLGAVAAIHVGQDDPTVALRALLDGYGADVVIEASGAQDAPALALSLVRSGGKILQVGLPAEPARFDFHALATREVEIVTSNGLVCWQDLPQALSLLSVDGTLAAGMVTAPIALDDLVEEGLRPWSKGLRQGKLLVRVQ